jgi:CheY-like chemotaxis protein
MMRVEFSRLRFIIIDDNAFIRRVMRALLHGFGAREVFEAEDGAAGLEAFMQHAPDIVITDWEMPILDGIEVAKMIRQPGSSPNAYVPIIMVSAHSEMRRVMQARDAGVTEFLVKPISAKSLYQRVLNAVANPRPFVRTSNYFGPDRRRGVSPDYAGPERRKGGQASETIAAKSLADKAREVA